MNTRRVLSVLTTAVLVASVSTPAKAIEPEAGTLAACAGPVVDDFSSGAYRSPDVTSGTTDSTKTGSMLGGRRFTRVVVGTNLYNFPTTLAINPGGEHILAFSAGYKTFSGLQIFYGLKSAGVLAPLNANFSCYDRFRVHFAAADLPLNFNMQVRSTSSTAPYQCGQNTQANLTNGFIADFPFTCFVTNDPNHPPVDWTHINLVDLLLGTASAIGANDYAIKKVELATGGCGLPICPPLP